MRRQKSAEGIVRLLDPAQGPNMKQGVRDSNLDDGTGAESPNEKADIAREGSRRNRQGTCVDASNITARRCNQSQMTQQLMEAVVERENKWVSYHCLINCTIYNVLHEPPDTEPYVRWCGRTGVAKPPPTRSGRARHCGSRGSVAASGFSPNAAQAGQNES